MMATCIRCRQTKISASFVQDKLNGIMSRCNAEADKLAADDVARGTVTVSQAAYFKALMDMAMTAFLGQIADACKCDALPRPRPARPKTWATCRNLHRTRFEVGTDPGKCAKCGEPVRSGGAA